MPTKGGSAVPCSLYNAEHFAFRSWLLFENSAPSLAALPLLHYPGARTHSPCPTGPGAALLLLTIATHACWH